MTLRTAQKSQRGSVIKTLLTWFSVVKRSKSLTEWYRWLRNLKTCTSLVRGSTDLCTASSTSLPKVLDEMFCRNVSHSLNLVFTCSFFDLTIELSDLSMMSTSLIFSSSSVSRTFWASSTWRSLERSAQSWRRISSSRRTLRS